MTETPTLSTEPRSFAEPDASGTLESLVTDAVAETPIPQQFGSLTQNRTAQSQVHSR